MNSAQLGGGLQNHDDFHILDILAFTTIML